MLKFGNGTLWFTKRHHSKLDFLKNKTHSCCMFFFFSGTFLQNAEVPWSLSMESQPTSACLSPGHGHSLVAEVCGSCWRRGFGLLLLCSNSILSLPWPACALPVASWSGNSEIFFPATFKRYTIYVSPGGATLLCVRLLVVLWFAAKPYLRLWCLRSSAHRSGKDLGLCRANCAGKDALQGPWGLCCGAPDQHTERMCKSRLQW